MARVIGFIYVAGCGNGLKTGQSPPRTNIMPTITDITSFYMTVTVASQPNRAIQRAGIRHPVLFSDAEHKGILLIFRIYECIFFGLDSILCMLKLPLLCLNASVGP